MFENEEQNPVEPSLGKTLAYQALGAVVATAATFGTMMVIGFVAKKMDERAKAKKEQLVPKK